MAVAEVILQMKKANVAGSRSEVGDQSAKSNIRISDCTEKEFVNLVSDEEIETPGEKDGITTDGVGFLSTGGDTEEYTEAWATDKQENQDVNHTNLGGIEEVVHHMMSMELVQKKSCSDTALMSQNDCNW